MTPRVLIVQDTAQVSPLRAVVVIQDQPEVSPLSRWGNVPAPIRAITTRRSLAPASHTRSTITQPLRAGFRRPCGADRAYHVSHLYHS